MPAPTSAAAPLHPAAAGPAGGCAAQPARAAARARYCRRPPAPAGVQSQAAAQPLTGCCWTPLPGTKLPGRRLPRRAALLQGWWQKGRPPSRPPPLQERRHVQRPVLLLPGLSMWMPQHRLLMPVPALQGPSQRCPVQMSPHPTHAHLPLPLPLLPPLPPPLAGLLLSLSQLLPPLLPAAATLPAAGQPPLPVQLHRQRGHRPSHLQSWLLQGQPQVAPQHQPKLSLRRQPGCCWSRQAAAARRQGPACSSAQPPAAAPCCPRRRRCRWHRRSGEHAARASAPPRQAHHLQ